MTFQFLDYRLRPSARQLTCDGAPVAVGARAYDLLLNLVANAGRVVGRDELMLAVWGDTVVGDNNLNVDLPRSHGQLGSITPTPLTSPRFQETCVFNLEVMHRRAQRVTPGCPC